MRGGRGGKTEVGLRRTFRHSEYAIAVHLYDSSWPGVLIEFEVHKLPFKIVGTGRRGTCQIGDLS